MTPEEPSPPGERLLEHLEGFFDFITKHRPLTWLDRILRGPVGPPQ